MATRPDNQNRDAILVMFLLGDAAVTAFASAIYAAQIASAEAAYADAVDAVGADASDATLPDDVLSAIASAAHDSAESIVNTYNESITNEAVRFADRYAGGDLKAALSDDLTSWASARADWKAAQIAYYESGRGYSAGMDWFVSDALDGSIDFPDGTALTDLVATVLPDSSSSDFCADWAGNSYPIDQYGDIPEFPAHISCQHFTVIDFAS